MNKLRSMLAGAGLFIGAILATVPAFGTIPSIPSTAPFSEPNQEIATFNAFIAMLNGVANPITGGVAPTTTTMTLGTFCTNTAGGSPQICNGQRGQALFTGITVAATGTTQTLTITNSAVTAASTCLVQPQTAFTAGSAVTVATVVPAAGSLAVLLVNAGTTTNAVTTGTLGFTCVN